MGELVEGVLSYRSTFGSLFSIRVGSSEVGIE